MFLKLLKMLVKLSYFHVSKLEKYFVRYCIGLYVKKPILEKQNNILLMMILEKVKFWKSLEWIYYSASSMSHYIYTIMSRYVFLNRIVQIYNIISSLRILKKIYIDKWIGEK